MYGLKPVPFNDPNAIALEAQPTCTWFAWDCDRLTIVSAPANLEFLRRAIQLATENVLSGNGGPFGAVIEHEGAIVGEGVNTVTSACDPTTHAEVNAIRAAAQTLNSFSLAGCTLYTSCQPCPMCLAAAYWARVDVIYYGASAADAAHAGFDDAFLYEEFRKDPAQRSLPAEQLLGEEARESFAAWKTSTSKIDY
jgi:tRNA(Arg) A34 adenosine deaminase TadA